MPDLEVDSESKGAKRRKVRKEASKLNAEIERLRKLLADRVLKVDSLLTRKTLRGVVKRGTGGTSGANHDRPDSSA